MDSSVIARQILRLCSVRSSFSPIIRLKPTTSAARIAASLRLGVDSVKKILIIDDLDLVTLKKYLNFLSHLTTSSGTHFSIGREGELKCTIPDMYLA